ncbi:MAG: hypothetical protein O6758_04090 [Planctomycetota bacterium]|nr:hypothetical protein [Planctomycetota bacterium]
MTGLRIVWGVLVRGSAQLFGLSYRIVLRGRRRKCKERSIVATASALLGLTLTAHGGVQVTGNACNPDIPSSAYQIVELPSGHFNVSLTQLYSPFGSTFFEIHPTSPGVIIDNVVIDVDGPPAGSPVIVRVLPDCNNPLVRIKSVGSILQTGTGETLLNKVEVEEDIGFVQVEAIGDLFADRDIVGPDDPPLQVKLRHYGPVTWKGAAPLTVERQTNGDICEWQLVTNNFVFIPARGDDNSIIAIAATGAPGFEVGYEYRIQATGQLLCDNVLGAPPVNWASPYVFSVESAGPAASDADISGPGGVPDGCVDAFDLAALLAAWCSVADGNPCGTCGP